MSIRKSRCWERGQGSATNRAVLRNGIASPAWFIAFCTWAISARLYSS